MNLNLLAEVVSLVAVALATYVGLRLKPLEDRLMKLEQTLSSHLEETGEMLANYNRWRGEVTAELRLQTELLRKLLQSTYRRESDNR